MLEECGGVRRLPVATAVKAAPVVPCRAIVAQVARPCKTLIMEGRPVPSQTPQPSKRLQPHPAENTAAKIARLCAPPVPKAKACSPLAPVVRSLEREFDNVSDGKGNHEPGSSLVFSQPLHSAGPYVDFTSSPAQSIAPSKAPPKAPPTPSVAPSVPPSEPEEAASKDSGPH